MERKSFDDVFKGFRIALGFAVTFAALAFAGAFAAAAWGALPNATTGTTLSSSAWNDIVSQMNVLTSAMSINSGNVSISTGKTLSAGKLQVTDTVTAWSVCSTDGLIAKDTSGAALSCKTWLWTSLSGTGPQGPVGPSWSQWPTGPTGSTGPTGATWPQWATWTSCWAPQVEIWGCRANFHDASMTACDWRTCNACGCWAWNPGWRQIILQNPGY